MSSLRGERKRKFKAEINVVPYIDVMLVLLVIFMVAAPMSNPSVINLPTAGQSVKPPAEYIEIAIKADATSIVSVKNKSNAVTDEKGRDLDRKQLMQLLRQLHQEQPDVAVMVSADKDIKYDEVIQVISEAKKLGIARVALATK